MTGEMGDGDERRVVEEQQKVEMEGPSMSPATHTSAEMESRRSTDVEVKEEQRTCAGRGGGGMPAPQILDRENDQERLKCI
jgi:hypothetical protein